MARPIPSRWSVLLATGTLVAGLISAGCGGSGGPAEPTPSSSQPPTPSIPTGISAALTGMLEGLSQYINQALAQNQDNLPRNPQNRSQIEAKIAMLQSPSLAAAIINNRRWVELTVTSINGRTLPIAVVFPLENMRGEANDAARALEPVLPILERFYDVPFPSTAVRVWYGFVIGNTGGGGVINSEDRTTYESRTGPNRLPFDAILAHELGHSYVLNESLTQFLEMYAYNLVRAASTDPRTWIFTRSWIPNAATNQDSAAVLDVYQLIGHDATQRAYRAIYPLRPPYGSPLSSNVIQAFLSQVPADLQPAVSEKLARVTF